MLIDFFRPDGFSHTVKRSHSAFEQLSESVPVFFKCVCVSTHRDLVGVLLPDQSDIFYSLLCEGRGKKKGQKG